MDYAILLAATDHAASLVDVARAAEERGFESIWVPEHIHMPVKTESRYPFSPDGSIPDTHYHLINPFVGLAAMAGATQQIKLATGICLVPEREPLLLAKQVASLDYVSGGRFIFGVGAGWAREELESLGVPFDERWRITDDRIAALKVLWTEDEAEYHGAYDSFPATNCYPKPISTPHPPIYVGAISKWALRRVAAWGDGWLPNRPDPEMIGNGIAEIRRLATEIGRDPDAIGTSLFGTRPDVIYESPALLEAFERAGVERVIFALPPAAPDVVMPALDKLTAFLEARRERARR